MLENASEEVANGFSLNMIGWRDGASFLGQSPHEVRQNQINPRLVSKLNWKLL